MNAVVWGGGTTAVMAGLVPAVHVLPRGTKNVNARDEPGHDDFRKFTRRAGTGAS